MGTTRPASRNHLIRLHVLTSTHVVGTAEGIMDTPSSIMYSDLKNFGQISNHEVALAVLNPEGNYGGTSIRARAASDRTFLSREVVHAAPGQISSERFADLTFASLSLARQMARKLGDDPLAWQRMDTHYGGVAAQAMRKVLEDFSLDGTLYANAAEKLVQSTHLSDQSRATLLLMLFVSTGCLGNPSAALAVVEAHMARSAGTGISTTETTVGAGFAHATEPVPADVRLGLLRLAGSAVRGSVQPLSLGHDGTVVGALAAGPDGINTVDFDVSRNHLHIWRGEDGEWYAQGMGSTNGTVLVSGNTHEASVIEPPRAKREPGRKYPPVRISNSDVLCLGSTTRFLVVRVLDDQP